MNTREILILAACLTLAGPLAAEEKAMDKSIDLVSGPPEQCIPLVRIDHAEIIDDQNIAFHMKNGDIYRNHMPNACPGLRPHDTYMYRTSLNQLCNVDIITQLDQIGFGFSPGASCGLGMFYPVTKDDVAKLKERVEARGKQ